MALAYHKQYIAVLAHHKQHTLSVASITRQHHQLTNVNTGGQHSTTQQNINSNRAWHEWAHRMSPRLVGSELRMTGCQWRMTFTFTAELHYFLHTGRRRWQWNCKFDTASELFLAWSITVFVVVLQSVGFLGLISLLEFTGVGVLAIGAFLLASVPLHKSKTRRFLD